MSKKIYTVGDSHSTKEHGGWGGANLKYEIRNYHLGPKLMYSFGKEKQFILKDVKDEDYVIFCLGEIDCRCHVGKYEPNWMENIDSLVKEYFDAINKNVERFNNLNVFVYNVVPVFRRDNETIFSPGFNASFPVVGKDRQRKMYVDYMNKKLNEYCLKNSFVFIDVSKEYSDEEGFLRDDLGDGRCHIKDITFVENFLKNHIR